VNTLAGLAAKNPVLPSDLIQIAPSPALPVASLDGKGNNPLHSNWGAAGTDLLRWSPAAYTDGIASPSGADRPGARLISNTVSIHTTTAPNNRQLSSWVYGWGQFIDHDIGLTTTGSTAFNIPVPTGDPSFDPNSTGAKVIPLSRSNFDVTTGTATPSVGQQVLQVTYRPAAPKR
jgi:hypothetical protein